MAQDSVKKIKLVEPNTIGTHSGQFHCDEVIELKFVELVMSYVFK